MEKGSEEFSIAGTSSTTTSSKMQEKINRFLETGKFAQGSTLTTHELSLVIQKLGRTPEQFSLVKLDNDYVEFLNEYGSIYGEGLEINGPLEDNDNSEKKIEHLTSTQRGFENLCKFYHMKDKQIKSCWLIGGMDQGDKYYINLSSSTSTKNNPGYIYSMHRDTGRSKIFAENFLDFLDQFYKILERKDKERAYEKEVYDGEVGEEEEI